MNKIYVFLMLCIALGCNNETKKNVISVKKPIPAYVPKITVDGKPIKIDTALITRYNNKLLQEFYKSTDYYTVWQSKKSRKTILDQLQRSEEEGLKPTDYNMKYLVNFENKIDKLNNLELAKYDVLLTYSLQLYISNLTHGKLNPIKLYTDWELTENKIDINKTLINLLKTDSLFYKIELLKPNHIVYKRLKKALVIINTYPKEEFTKIEIVNKIVLNDTNPSIIDIKKRLIYWKDMKPKDSLSLIYDNETLEAVKKFQIRHGLSADGVIGKGTIESLNFSKKQRKEQIIANLERWKWFPKKMENEYLIVNIPDYKLSVVKGIDTIRTHKVIVGRAKRKTPVLSSKLTHVIFNPTWTVPPTILKEDVIPAISRNRNYLAQTNIKIYDNNGNIVPSSSWKLSNAKSYRYVQSPGTFNSLGMVKLIFPNRFSVYLHDTNHRDFFEKQMRSLSSGCVRVNHPLELTEYLLGDATNWNLEKITEILQNEKTKQLNLKKEVFIHILYWTAWSEKNTLIFRDDIYTLDTELYDKLGK